MARQKAEDIRNVIVAGHGGTGKTSLVDMMLYVGGANSRVGSVKEGTSVSDTAEDEVEGTASIDLHLLHCTHGGKLMHVLDTPGRTDFIAQYVSALRAAENVLVTVDGYSGIQVNTRKVWKMARARGKALGIVVTRLDMENVNLEKILGDIQATFGKNCVPLFVPDRTGAGISKVEPVLAGGSPLAKQYHDPLLEAIVEADEALTMRYLEGEDITADARQMIPTAIQKGTLVPVFCVAFKEALGVKELMDCLAEAFVPASAVTAVKVIKAAPEGATVEDKELDPNTFVAQVFKTFVDEHKGRMAMMRVLSGSIVAGANFYNAGKDRSGRLGKLFKFFGSKHEEVESVSAGELFAAARMDEMDISSTITDGTWKEPLEPLAFPAPMVAFAVRPKSRADEQRLSTVIQRYMTEDPTFRMEVDSQSKEMVVYGMSELHLNVILARMARRQNVNVDTKLPKISYRETITREVSDYYRHKKQTGGSGEFAEVHFRMRPYAARDENLNFVNALRGDNVRRQFVPSVEKGCRAIMEQGILTGSPVIWVEVEFFDGKDHPVDGKDMAFQKAAKECFKKCFLLANPVLLEPMVTVEVTFPPAFAGEISQYLNSKRGRIQGMDSAGEQQVIRAGIPAAEIQTFSSDLRSMTQGQADYLVEPAGFEQVPPQVQHAVVDKYQKERGMVAEEE